MRAIPQLVSAPANPIPIVEHFKWSHQQCEPPQMFPRLPARASFVADTNFLSGTQKMFLILLRNILCPQQMFPSLRSPRNIMSNKVSSFARALSIGHFATALTSIGMGCVELFCLKSLLRSFLKQRRYYQENTHSFLLVPTGLFCIFTC